MKSKMLLRTLHKTKHLVHKTLKNFKCFLFEEYQKLPKANFARNPFFSSGNSSRKMPETDDYYRVFSDQWASNIEEQLHKGKGEANDMFSSEDGGCCQTNDQNSVENVQINTRNAKEKGCKQLEGTGQESCRQSKSGSSRVLVHRMKEFEMFEVDDVDHQLDIEEVLHYYSRLTCPVYVDIVDDFFMDMYSEFLVPQPSISVNSSMRRLGPVKL